MDRVIKVWTDGACFPNPGAGGWAWTTLQGQQESGGKNPTTNQVMELTAAIMAIKGLRNPGIDIELISDSMYVIKGATVWSLSWIRNGWRNSKGQPVANKELWVELLELLWETNVTFRWVKGHSGDAGNEAADVLATEASGANAQLIEKCRAGWHGEEARQ